VQLLISVRDPEEARTALAGGAHIIDAKDPTAGALGMVDSAMLREIRAVVPRGRALSAALGDAHSLPQVRRNVRSSEGADLWFAKFGFGGISQPKRVAQLLEAAVGASYRWLGSPAVVAVAYADWERARSLEPARLVPLAAAAGARGLLLDTAFKDQGNLFQLWPEERIAELVATVREAGLLTALAGGLGLEEVERARAMRVDVVGVRGAACEGARTGTISLKRVSALVAAAGEPGRNYDPVLPSKYSRQRSHPDGPTDRQSNPYGKAWRK
jgi:hypothetical protein